MYIAVVPVVVAVVFFVLEFLKLVTKSNETFKKFIPLLAGFLGMALSVLFFYLAPETLGVSDIVQALMLGLASGLAATGTHQAFKQISKE